MNKKLLSLLSTGLMVSSLLVGCNSTEEPIEESIEEPTVFKECNLNEGKTEESTEPTKHTMTEEEICEGIKKGYEDWKGFEINIYLDDSNNSCQIDIKDLNGGEQGTEEEIKTRLKCTKFEKRMYSLLMIEQNKFTENGYDRKVYMNCINENGNVYATVTSEDVTYYEAE